MPNLETAIVSLRATASIVEPTTAIQFMQYTYNIGKRLRKIELLDFPLLKHIYFNRERDGERGFHVYHVDSTSVDEKQGAILQEVLAII